MASQQVIVTATGGSTPIPIDLKKFMGGVGILVTIPAGSSGTYSVEVTGDKPTTGFVNWNLHDTLQNKTVSANSNLAFPVTGVRINPASIVGSIVLSVVQVDL